MQAQEVRSCLQNVLWAQRGKFNPIVKQPEAKRHPKSVERTASQLSVGQAGTFSQTGSTGSAVSRTASTSSQDAMEITVHLIEDPLAVDPPTNFNMTFLSSFAEMKSVRLALQHMMDEQQIYALVCQGLSQLKEECLTEDELFTLHTFQGLSFMHIPTCVSTCSYLPVSLAPEWTCCIFSCIIPHTRRTASRLLC